MKSKKEIKLRIKKLLKPLDELQGKYYHNRRRKINIQVEELKWVLG